ncbi:DUF6531 domain-containing protein [Aeromicrobium piscarium]|uniref:RHS repeat protein n=1 Tax=Aeromicrobium piscarium TaxID=2590901 RepID=A0A554S7B3_9ACTN|nr:DUF6531 domain-containing protein [Aeromicrobium piscarium]TSD62229.1 hypothetical protein FNM00_12825 [Aeromicrobium piscarium]
MRVRVLGAGIALRVGIAGSVLAVSPTAMGEPLADIEPEVWEAPAEVNRTPVGGEPDAAWSYVPADDGESSQQRRQAAAIDDAVAAPGLGVQEHYGFEEFAIDDRQSIAVNLGNGNLVVRATDVTINGPEIGLSLERFYNGLSERPGAHGPRWAMSSATDVGLEVGPSSIVFRAPSGFRARFSEDGDGWAPPAGLQADLSEQDNGQWVVEYRRTGERLVFTAGGYLLRNEDRNGNALTYAYNSDNTIASVTDAAGRVTTFDHDAGKLASITDPANRVTEYTYDDAHRLTEVTGPDGTTRSYGYADGRLTSVTSGEGHETAIGYDSTGRVTSVDHAGEATTSFAYAADDTTITDAADNDTQVALDDEGRVESVTDPLGRKRSQEWTPNSQVSSSTDAMGGDGGEGNVTSYSYDDANNPTQVSMPTGAAARASYTSDEECGSATQDHQYLVKCASDPAGNQSTFEYDGTGNLMSTSDTSDGGTRELSYTRQDTDDIDCGAKKGQICTATDGNDGVTTYTYDGDGNITSIDPPGPLAATTYAYDSVGRVTSTTDGRGQTTNYGYDRLDRLSFETAPDVQAARDYDADGNITAEVTYTPASGRQLRVDRTWDARDNQLTEKITDSWTVLDTIEMGYDSRGNMTSYSDKSAEVTYAYDAANQLSVINGGTDDPVIFSYDRNGLETTRELPGETVIYHEYDDSGRLTRITALGADGDEVVDYEYSFTNAEDEDQILIQSRTDHAGLEMEAGTQQTYEYDSLNRLVSVTEDGPGGIQDWLYDFDDNGNRTRAEGVDYEFNASNQITSIDGWADTIGYDENGNITEQQNRYSAGYNAFDQATEWNLGNTEQTMSYLGSTNAARHTTDVDFGTEYEIRGPLGLAYTETDSDLIDRDQSRRTFLRTPDGELIGSWNDAGGGYAVTDHLGSVVAVFNSGEVTGTVAYDTWGKERSRTGDLIPVGYAGGETAPADMVKFGARFYDPSHGIFTQMDPAGQEDSPYLYAA